VTTVTDGADPVLDANETDLGGLGYAGYAYTRPITVTNDGSGLSDQPVEVALDTASLINAGKLQADCDDLRFTTAGNATLLDHEVTSGCDTSDTSVWVNVPDVPNGTSTIRVYYGDVYGGSDAAVDPVNESDTADPQPTTFVGAEEAFTDPTDADGDGIPDRLEATLCSVSGAREQIDSAASIGRCASDTDYQPRPSPYPYTIRVPQWVNQGPDVDGDDLPATVAIEWLHVTIASQDAEAPHVWNAGATHHTIDPADHDSTQPSIDTVCEPVPRQTSLAYSGGDDDGDNVPDDVQNAGADVCVSSSDGSVSVNSASRVREWTMDSDDLDASAPNTTLPSARPIPVEVDWSQDRDADGLPGREEIDQLRATWDTVRSETILEDIDRGVLFDPDDQDAREPLNAGLDLDGDDVPQLNERHACEVQDESTNLDGFCTDLGTNYHPPQGYPTSFEFLGGSN
jgi:hypothetical protein